MIDAIKDRLVLIRGAGDIATGIGHRLLKSGFQVIFLEVENPTMVRRKVAFAEAVYDQEITIEGITGRLTYSQEDAMDLLSRNIVPIMIDPYCTTIKALNPVVVVDAILAKKNLGTTKDMAEIVIGVGPGFKAGEDVHAVIETNRGHMLGKVILAGEAAPNTGIPGNIKGYTSERVLRANNHGQIRVVKDIGHHVKRGDVVATIDGTKIIAKIDGVVRGIIRDNSHVTQKMKIGDIDPRGDRSYCYLISDKSRAVAGGVLEAILYLINRGSAW